MSVLSGLAPRIAIGNVAATGGEVRLFARVRTELLNNGAVKGQAEVNRTARKGWIMTRLGFGLIAAVLLGQAAWAEDAALILANDRYERLSRVPRADDALDARSGLEDMGFAVVGLRNGRSDQVGEALAEFLDLSEDADRHVIVLAGQFVTDGDRTWFLTSDSKAPSLFGLGNGAVSVESLLQVASRSQGQAIVMLAPAGLIGAPTDDWLRYGLGRLDAPQGVTVIRGLPRDIADFASGPLVTADADLAGLLADQPELLVTGYLPKVWTPMPEEDAGAAVAVVPQVDAGPNPAIEEISWARAVAMDTVEGFRAYLRVYPNGAHRSEAETLIAEIIAEPNRAARKAEDALGLSRDQRREIQRDLTLLDYNTRGIDGIFGPGSRRAIANWQQVNGYSQTTYLTTEQISRLDAQAARRSAELEAEAERQRAEVARLDRGYWEETGGKGDEPGYRAYIARYPDGIFAELAREQLRLIEAQKREAAAGRDRTAWDSARSINSIAGYRDYLRAFPQGAFVAEAEDRIVVLEAENSNAGSRAQGEAAEAALNLNPITARLIEGRLRQLGLDPGEVDGVFDNATRRAIRRYQSARNLNVTGYLDDGTIVRLLADSGIMIGR